MVGFLEFSVFYALFYELIHLWDVVQRTECPKQGKKDSDVFVSAVTVFICLPITLLMHFKFVFVILLLVS